MSRIKLSPLFLMFLILNINMVVPAISYAAAEETCACHLTSSDHQCHLDKECKSCLAHGHKNPGHEAAKRVAIKGQPCSTAPAHNDMAIPALSSPFLIAELSIIIPAQVSSLLNLIENPIYGVTVTPSEKPPMA